MNIKNSVLWRAKIAAKIALTHLKVPYGFWKKIGLFEHGQMDDPEYVMRIFNRHYQLANLSANEQGWHGLELGPGDSVASGIIAHAHGATKSYLVDVGPFALTEMRGYRELVAHLQNRGFDIPSIAEDSTFEQFLKQFNIVYLTQGNTSLCEIADQSIDLCWSQAVLEHVRAATFEQLVAEIKRVMKQDGANSHRVDLKDHLVASLNNLRFSHKIWESPLFANSGFYTNRIRLTPMIDMFETAGFRIELLEVNRWDHLPILRRKLNSEFQHYSDEELKVSGFHFTAKL